MYVYVHVHDTHIHMTYDQLQVQAKGLKDQDDAKKADPKGVVHVLSSVLMKGYGKAMLRKVAF